MIVLDDGSFYGREAEKSAGEYAELKIEKVRHLRDIKIPLERDFRKHLILTGCNGSGKTSVLEDLAGHLNGIATAAEEIEQAEGHK